jgi:hypothetical protein
MANVNHTDIFWSVVVCVLVVILGLLVFGLCCRSIYLGLRGRKAAPAVVSPDSARKHIALIWLIRGAEGLILVPVLLLILMIALGFVLSLNPFRSPPVYTQPFSLIMLVAVLLVSAALILKIRHRSPKPGHGIFQNFQKVTANSVSNFGFIFSALAAHDLYQLMPPKLPHPIHGYSAVLMVFLDRNILSMIVFWGLWSLTKSVLLRVLGLNPPAAPPDSTQGQPSSSPDRPFVPFNPYDLSKNLPLRPQ